MIERYIYCICISLSHCSNCSYCLQKLWTVIQHFRENSVSLHNATISLHVSSLTLLVQTAPSVGKCLIIHMRPQTAKKDLKDQHHSTIQLKGATLKSTLFVLCMLQITKTFLIGTHRKLTIRDDFHGKLQLPTCSCWASDLLTLSVTGKPQTDSYRIHERRTAVYVWWDDGLSHSLTWRKNSIWQRRDKEIALRMKKPQLM